MPGPGGRRHTLLLPGVELLPTERVDEHGVLLEILLERPLLREEVCVLVVDEDLLVLHHGTILLSAQGKFIFFKF